MGRRRFLLQCAVRGAHVGDPSRSRFRTPKSGSGFDVETTAVSDLRLLAAFAPELTSEWMDTLRPESADRFDVSWVGA